MLDVMKEVAIEIKNDPIPYVIGSIINIFWFLIIPYIFVLGYMERLMFAKSYGISTLPKWNNLKNLVLRGIKLLSIITIYLVPPLAIIVLSGNGAQLNTTISYNQHFNLPIYTWVGITVFLILGFLLIGAIGSYVKREKLIDAFNIREIIYLMSSNPKEYIKIYLWLFIVNFTTLFVLVIPILGLVLFGFLNFYVLTVGYMAIVEKLNTKKVKTQEENVYQY